MTDRQKYQKILNILVKRDYPFIKDVEVYRLKKLNSFNLDLDVNLHITRKKMLELVDFDCIDQIPDHESIFMSLFSFGLCTKGLIKRDEFEDYLVTIFQSTIDSERILVHRISVNVIAPDINGEY